jgi:hypothetical protein
MINRIGGRVRAMGSRIWSSRRDPRWGVVAAVAVIGLVALVLTYDSGPGPRAVPEPPGFSVSPEGNDVPRLAPIKVTFASPPSERNGEKLIQLEPVVKGSYAWMSDRTILFQPDFPGFYRGFSYTVHVPARPETGLLEDVSKQFITAGALAVVTTVPADGDTEVPANAQVLVQFSRSVAPLTLLSEQRKDPVIAFDPPLEGKGEWLNTSIYRFTPSKLAPNTTYRLKIGAGLSSAVDGVLKQDYPWSFTTFGPAVAGVTPDARTEFAAPKQPVAVKFNQPMDRASVEAGFKLTGPSNVAVAGTFFWADSDATVTFTPAAQLGFKTAYQVLVPKGLKGARGGETATEWRSTFTTVGTPSVTTRPANGEVSAQRYGVQFTFTNPMNVDSLDGKISISGFTADEIRQGLSSGERQLYVGVTLKPSTTYTMTVAGGATDRYGQVLDRYTATFTTGALPSAVNLAVPGGQGTYSASVEPILYYHATNMPSASFTLYPLTPGEMKLLTYDGKSGPNWLPSKPPQRRWTETNSGGRDEVVIASTSLSGGGVLPKGDYWVQTSGQYLSEMAFSVVDTVLVTKLSFDELLVWAIDHDTGKPVANATVHAEGAGITGSDARTDANGLVTFPASAPLPGKNFDRRYYVTLDDAGHRGMVSSNWQRGSEPYQLNLPVEYYAREYVGQLYTDRPIYRPGESVEYKGVVRRDDDAQYQLPASEPPLDFVIMNSQGKEVRREEVRPNEFGTFAGTFALPNDASVGDYSISIQPRDANQRFNFVAGNSFLVAEFRKPEFQVTVETGKPSYINGDSIDVQAKASFFFGGGVGGAEVAWSALGSPFNLRVEGYERYSFSDYDYYREAVYRAPTRATGKATTNADGVAAFPVPAVLAGSEGAQQFTISATVTDQNAQQVASSTTATVHPAELYAGIRPAQYVAVSGKEASIELVTVDTDGKLLANRKVVVNVYDRVWVTTKEQTPEGARRYKSEPKHTLLATLDATTNEKGVASVRYTPVKAGTLRLVAEVTDSKGRVARSAAYLWVSGTEFASWQISNDDSIRLVADKDRYSVGDTAEVLVPAPFAAATGLVTVERGKLITRSVQSFPTNSERLRVPIVDRDVPDVFVSVVLYRPPTAADPVPRYKVGYVQLPVSTDTRVLNVSIKPDKQQTKPGENVRYDIKVTDSAGKGVRAELAVAVIDKALLSLEDERGPDGLKAFWFERGLGVITASSMAVSINRSNDVISEPPQGGKGGGGLDTDRLRQDFRNTAFWNAQLVTKDDGTASVDVKMPDNLTTWRMKVRAVSGATQVGEATNEVVSTQPLLIRPALPRFLRVGDSVTLRTLVRNATAKSAEVKVTLDAQGVDVSGDDSKSATIPAGQSKMFDWPAKVTAEGTAKLTFTASGGGQRDAVVQELPIYLDVTPEATATGGIAIGEAMYEALYLPVFAILKAGSLDVSVQPSLTGSMAGELMELAPIKGYRDSTERVASRLIATSGVRRAAMASGANPDSYNRQIDSDLAGLIGRQRPDGGWSWCDAPLCQSDPNVTGWALMAIGEGRRDGKSVDAGVVSRASLWVLSYLNRTTDVAHPADPNQKAFLLYGLAAAGGGDSALSVARATFEQYRSQLKNWGRAYLVLAFAEAGLTKDDAKVSALLSDLSAATIPSANGNHWEDAPTPGMFMTDTATTALVLDALVRLDPQHPLAAQTVRWLVMARGAQKWVTNVERARAILALSEYGALTGELAGDFDYRVLLNERDVLSGHFKPGDGTKTDAKRIPLTTIQPGKVSLLTVMRDFAKPGRLYYMLNLRYMTPAKEVEAVNRGFAVSHEYSLLDNPAVPVSRAKVGDTIRVKLTVIAPADRRYAVVDDMLPAGFEPVDPRLKTVDPKLKAQLEAERAQAAAGKRGDYYAPWLRWYYSPWQHVDTRDDRVTLYADQLPKGVYEYIYYVRATSAGDFFVAPAHAQESYFPDVFGRSDSGRFVVEP